MATTGQQVANEDVTDPIGRVGLVTQGVLYGIVGLLALRVGHGDTGEQADTRGALEAVARQRVGSVLLVILALGLAGMALWRASLAWRSTEDAGPRLANAGRALLYGGLTVACVRLLFHVGGSSGSGEQQATSTVLGWPGGRILVGAAGLAVMAGGLWQLRQPFTTAFRDKLRTGTMSDATERTVTVVGSVGFVARGIAFGLVGLFVLRAAIDYHADHKVGLDAALRELAASPHGSIGITAVAAGLFAFGVYRLLDAAFRKRSET